MLPEKIETVTQAATLIADAASVRNGAEPLIIVDEFDRVKSAELKTQFADLIKRIHDMRIPVRFLFCGIGKKLDELIGSHLSADCAIAPFELEPLTHDARWAIIENAAARLGVEIPREFMIRIGQISDGFPYYVHLIANYLFWEIFEHLGDSDVASSEDFHKAIRKAIDKAQASLRHAYNGAIQKTTGSTDYEEALWAVAESTHLERQLREIYGSYLRVMENRKDRRPLDIDRFRTRLYALCKPSHGEVLIRKLNSWYAFQENVLRGYVRLVAERTSQGSRALRRYPPL